MLVANKFRKNLYEFLYNVYQPSIMQRLVVELRKQIKSVNVNKLNKLTFEVLPFRNTVGVDRRRIRRFVTMVFGIKEPNIAVPTLYKRIQNLLEFEVINWGGDPIEDTFRSNNIEGFTKKFFPIKRIKMYQYKFVLLIRPRAEIVNLDRMIYNIVRQHNIDGIGEWDFKSGNIDWEQTKQRLIKDINSEYDVSRTRAFLISFVRDDRYMDDMLHKLIEKFSVQPHMANRIYRNLWSGFAGDIRKFYEYLVRALNVK